MSGAPILVTGATGTQGSATIDALLSQGLAVRALVRDATSSAAQALARRDVELAQGDFDDAASLAAALEGASGVFSVQLPSRPDDPDSELRTGWKLIEAARTAGGTSIVHTSVARAGDHECFTGWSDGRWDRAYWDGKARVNAMVRSAGFAHWTILKPAFIMDNFIPPKATWMFPMLSTGILNTAMSPGARLDLIAASDIGRFAASAFTQPARFDEQEIDLAAESLDTEQIAAAIARATGKQVTAMHMTPEDAIAAGVPAGLVSSQLWANVEGYKVGIVAAEGRERQLEAFQDWAFRHRRRFAIGPAEGASP